MSGLEKGGTEQRNLEAHGVEDQDTALAVCQKIQAQCGDPDAKLTVGC
jgi:hypothetical protein